MLGIGGGVYGLTRLTTDDEPRAEEARGRRGGRWDRDGGRGRASRVDRLLGEGMQAMVAEDWGTALGKATQALSSEPENAAALDLQARAEGEIENRATFRKLEQAFEVAQVENVSRLYGEIPGVSAYREKAKPLYEKTRDEWLAPRLEEAKVLAKKGQCKKLEPIQAKTAALFPDALPEVEGIANACRPRAATQPGKRPVAPAKPEQAAESLVSEARTAAATGDAGKALRLCEKALAMKPGHEDATLACAMAACNLRNVDKARRYTNALQTTDARRRAVQTCRRSGVRLRRKGRDAPVRDDRPPKPPPEPDPDIQLE
jgi:hypothetical protein